jgi:hypothetical protein
VQGNGRVFELDKSGIHNRDLMRAGGLKQKVKSFAMPGVEAGAIVEYRWKEIRHEPRGLYMRLQFQREFPVHRVTYFVKPLSRDYTTYSMAAWPFNCQPSKMHLENDGFNSVFLEKVPAFKDEPMMPGEPNVRPWMLIYYHDGSKRERERYWNDVGKDAYRDLKASLKLNDELKQAAAKAVAGAEEPEAKVIQLIRYVRQNFRSLFDARVTDAERARIIKSMPKDRHRTSVEVFKSGIGTADELNTLFAALASEAGLEARPALIASRNDVFFSDQMLERYFLSNIDMAVKLGDAWRLFDVSARRLPPNLLSWFEEGVQALVADPKTPVFISTSLSPPETSATERTAKFTLGGDGALEGEVEEKLTGHTASIRRDDFEGESESRQQEQVKEQLTSLYPQAEVTNLKIENGEDPEKTLIIRYRIKIPTYAQRTGRRLFIQPFYFQRGSAPLFSAGERTHDIHFRHAWKETDRVTISIPEGYELDNPDSPGSLNLGAPGSYTLEMAINEARELVCVRELVFGRKGIFAFPKASYGQIKKVFDEIHRRDSHTLSLKQVAAPAAFAAPGGSGSLNDRTER